MMVSKVNFAEVVLSQDLNARTVYLLQVGFYIGVKLGGGA